MERYRCWIVCGIFLLLLNACGKHQGSPASPNPAPPPVGPVGPVTAPRPVPLPPASNPAAEKFDILIPLCTMPRGGRPTLQMREPNRSPRPPRDSSSRFFRPLPIGIRRSANRPPLH